jgi:hypothetical protein
MMVEATHLIHTHSKNAIGATHLLQKTLCRSSGNNVSEFAARPHWIQNIV